MTPTRPDSPRGFSLVELLAVCAVIALLAGVLLPSLAGARESARSCVCSSNLRQLALANDLYAGDYDERYAPGAANIGANLDRWHGSRSTPSQAFVPEGGSLTAYLGGPDGPREPGTAPPPPGTAARRDGVRVCPTFAPSLALLDGAGAAQAGFERACGGYGYNNAFVGTDRGRVRTDVDGDDDLWPVSTDRAGARRSRFSDPTGTFAFADSALAVDGPSGPLAIEYSFLEPRFWPDQTRGDAARADPSMHFRHATPRSGGAGSANTARLDGHVGPERLGFTWSSGLYGADPGEMGIGWARGADDNGFFDYD